jgi:ABC-2 type transport system permease protein
MSDAVLSAHPRRRAESPLGDRPARLSTVGIVRAETIKFFGQPGMLVALAASVVLLLGIGMLGAYALANQIRQGHLIAANSIIQIPGMGLTFAQLILSSCAVALVSMEWSTGAIIGTIAATQRRMTVFAVKAGLIAVTSVAITAVSGVGVVLLSRFLLNPVDRALSFADGRVLEHLAGMVVSAVMICLVGIGLGALLRNTVAAVVSLVGLLLVLPLVFGAIPWDLVSSLARFLPLNSGNVLLSVVPIPNGLSDAHALLTLVLWAVAALAAGAFRLTRTDL